jgi:hypothetical protein
LSSGPYSRSLGPPRSYRGMGSCHWGCRRQPHSTAQHSTAQHSTAQHSTAYEQTKHEGTKGPPTHSSTHLPSCVPCAATAAASAAVASAAAGDAAGICVETERTGCATGPLLVGTGPALLLLMSCLAACAAAAAAAAATDIYLGCNFLKTQTYHGCS